MPASSEPRPTTARPGTETAVLDNVPSRPATTPRPAPRPHETQVLTPEEIAGTQYGNATMPAESLRDFARNPRVRTAVDPERTSRFSRMTKFDEPAEMVKARSRWLQVPEARKVGIDAELRRAIDEAAAVGDKWARRAQQDLNAGKFNFSYEPGITKYDGLALSSDHVVINPFDGTRIRSGDELASILIHEYIHAYKGGTKFASNLPGFTGSPTRGRYNEGRAYLGEAIFNRNLGRARQLTGAPLDPTAANLVNKYMNTGNLASQTPGYARGSRAFENLREYITDHIYGGKYAGNPALAAERLAAFRGGGMEHIQKYIRDQLQKRPGDADEVMAALLKEIEREGGRFLPRP